MYALEKYLGEGSYGAVFQSGYLYAIKYVDTCKMSEYAIERHILGESLSKELPDGSVIELEGYSQGANYLVVRLIRLLDGSLLLP
jgi:hypothetical protein